MPASTEPSGILLELRAGLPRISALPCASCLFDLGGASGMVGGEPCLLKSAFLRRYAGKGSGSADPACAGFAPGYAETGDDWASDFGGDVTRTLS